MAAPRPVKVAVSQPVERVVRISVPMDSGKCATWTLTLTEAENLLAQLANALGACIGG